MTDSTHDVEYTDNLIELLETLWGDGYLSPGGPEEVDKVVQGLDLSGMSVLDIGCGSGGITLRLAEVHNAKHVTGIDVEAPVLANAKSRATRHDLAERVEFVKVRPGPFPFEEGTFDVVFSKDAIVHIADKETLASDIFRVLKHGGVFAASDWMISHDGTPSPEMADYIKKEDLGFGMASPTRYESALKAAGFEEVRLTNRNPWYREVARNELKQLNGPLHDQLAAAVGKEYLEQSIGIWEAMQVVLGTGEHCPHHIRAKKPD